MVGCFLLNIFHVLLFCRTRNKRNTCGLCSLLPHLAVEGFSWVFVCTNPPSYFGNTPPGLGALLVLWGKAFMAALYTDFDNPYVTSFKDIHIDCPFCTLVFSQSILHVAYTSFLHPSLISKHSSAAKPIVVN